MNHSNTPRNPTCARPTGDERRFPVPLDLSFDPRASDQWRLATRRLHTYLITFGYGEKRTSEILAQVLARVATDPGWASGRRVVALAMAALQVWFIEGAGSTGQGQAPTASFAQARLLTVSPSLAVSAPPLKGRWQSFPPVRRRGMVAAKRPAQTLLRLPWWVTRRHGR